MKKFILASLFIVIAFLSQAQKMNPVNWSFQAIKKGDKQYDVVLTANVEAPWHIYSQFVKKGPIPTTIEFKTNPLVQIKGAAKEIGKLEKKMDIPIPNRSSTPDEKTSQTNLFKFNK